MVQPTIPMTPAAPLPVWLPLSGTGNFGLASIAACAATYWPAVPGRLHVALHIGVAAEPAPMLNGRRMPRPAIKPIDFARRPIYNWGDIVINHDCASAYLGSMAAARWLDLNGPLVRSHVNFSLMDQEGPVLKALWALLQSGEFAQSAGASVSASVSHYLHVSGSQIEVHAYAARRLAGGRR